jgi:hypothetical protein
MLEGDIGGWVRGNEGEETVRWHFVVAVRSNV